jgi:arginyl-tRNA synthetase
MDYVLPKIRQEIGALAKQLLNVDELAVENASSKFDADLAIPCFSLAKQLDRPVLDIAQQLADNLKHEMVEKTEAIGGFVNIWLKSSNLARTVLEQAMDEGYGTYQSMASQEVLVEYTDPNPFKEFHIGHLYSNTVGESLARLHETLGAKVHRVSYHGDVGIHIAKAVWGIINLLDEGQTLSDIPSDARSTFLGQAYALGAKLYEDDESAKSKINEINRHIYSNDNEEITKLYETGKRWSFEYFESIYKRLNVSFEKQYFESQSAPIGIKLVKEHPEIFEQSDGAVIFRGEKYNLHTRVFVSSDGLPTYEAKDLGLTKLKDDDYPDVTKSIIITAQEQSAYFEVMLKALEQIDADLAHKTVHMSHGAVRLPSGKMSSRTGDVITANLLIDDIETAIGKRAPDSPAITENALAAVKYAFLKQNIGGDVVYDVDESINLEGQTGPYVQYAAVRAQSILEKVKSDASWTDYDWVTEKSLLFLVAEYPEVVLEAAIELAPHKVAQYIYELARELNRYYEQTNVKDAPPLAKSARIALLKSCVSIFRSALSILNIPIPKRM